MQTIKELENTSLFEQIATGLNSDLISSGSDRLAKVRGFQSVFKQVTRTPSIIRMLLHNEYEFVGQIDGSKQNPEIEAKLLSSSWYSSSFVIPNYGNMGEWVQKMTLECEAGKTVVALLPCRVGDR